MQLLGPDALLYRRDKGRHDDRERVSAATHGGTCCSKDRGVRVTRLRSEVLTVASNRISCIHTRGRMKLVEATPLFATLSISTRLARGAASCPAAAPARVHRRTRRHSFQARNSACGGPSPATTIFAPPPLSGPHPCIQIQIALVVLHMAQEQGADTTPRGAPAPAPPARQTTRPLRYTPHCPTTAQSNRAAPGAAAVARACSRRPRPTPRRRAGRCRGTSSRRTRRAPRSASWGLRLFSRV